MLVTVLLALPLRVRVLIRAVSAIAKGASTRWWAAMVVMIHGIVVLTAVKAGHLDSY
jgi:hypothetical protein